MWLGWTGVMVGVCFCRIGFVSRSGHPYTSRQRWFRYPEMAMLTCLVLLRTTVLAMYVLSDVRSVSVALSVGTMVWFVTTVGLVVGWTV